MTKEELIRDEDYTEEEAEKMVLQNKLDKANERIEELEVVINETRLKIEHDIKINKRSLQEEIKDADFKRLLNLWVKYDNELLEILSD